MKLRIMSDLHLEFGGEVHLEEGDVLILAGDIGIGQNFANYLPFFEEASEKFKDVFYIYGNHEYYHGDYDRVNFDIPQMLREFPNIHTGKEIVLKKDGVNIIGTTLWTSFGEVSNSLMYTAKHRMNDYRVITYKGCLLDPIDTTDFHYEALEFINKSFSKEDKNIVVTHHSPTLEAPTQYRGDSLICAYGSDLTEMINYFQPELWIHGHTHRSMDIEEGRTRIVCNPRGYNGYDINPGFNPGLEIEV